MATSKKRKSSGKRKLSAAGRAAISRAAKMQLTTDPESKRRKRMKAITLKYKASGKLWTKRNKAGRRIPG